ncbi:MAG: hypothetical protein IK136_02885 [Oscillospiraceae bacterium]|nr:hypothetical protein [Oscillospiraceae bacterium]
MGDTADAVFDAGKAAVGKAVGGARLAVDKLKDIHADTEIKALGLIFKPDLDTSDFRLPRMIRITEPDSTHKRSPFLLGALGHRSAPKGLEIVNIYPDRLAEFGINLFPDAESEFYYVDPGDDRQYIALDEYFGYIRQRRVNELVTLAKALGARHFKVTYKERRKRLTAKKVTANASARGIGKNGNGQWQHTADSDDFTSIAILAEMNCGGGEPVEAPVVYLKNEPEITHLIEMRMADPSDKLSLKKSIELITSSGIKKADAVKIDGALAALKCAGNVSMTSEVQDEARRVLDYEIEF